jgi:hypothetical protein
MAEASYVTLLNRGTIASRAVWRVIVPSTLCRDNGDDGVPKQRPMNGVEPEKSEDDIQRELLGPRGVPGAPDPAKMTP